MIYLDTPYVFVEWDEDLKCVRIQWRGFAYGAEFRDAHEKVLEALRDHNGLKLLADARGMKAVSPEDHAWMNDNWLPRSKALGIMQSALVQPKSALGQMSLHRIVAGAASVLPLPPGETVHFDDMEAAEKWIRSGR